MSRSLARLTEAQRDFVATWLPGARVLHDHSWGQVETTVLEVEHDSLQYIVKTGGDSDHHLTRELEAHEKWLSPWTSCGRAPRLVCGNVAAKVLVTEYLPGRLVLGDAAQSVPDTFRQAGELLAALHGQGGVLDREYEAAENATALARLEMPHRISRATVDRLAAVIEGWPTDPVQLVPTHGDWQPRNWLYDDGVVCVIDFGRAALRPAVTDFIRLQAQDFGLDRSRELEAEFIEGYGSDPRESDVWARAKLREAIGTGVWACRVGDEHFEEQGHRMIAAALVEAE